MPRGARRRSKTEIYHIVLRGVNKQRIFEDEEDSDMFLQTIELYKRACESNEPRMFDTYFPLNSNKQTDEGRQLFLTSLTKLSKFRYNIGINIEHKEV